MIEQFLKNFCINSKTNIIDIGCSGDKVTEVIKEDGIYYIKESAREKLDKEYFIYNYLKDTLPVPKVLFFLTDETKSVLITKKLEGEMICCDEIFDDMHHVIELAAKSLKILQSVDITGFPIYNSLSQKLALAKSNIEKKLVLTSDMNDNNQKRFKIIENAYKYLEENKIEEELCFSHGDLSIPNIFFKNDNISGFLDMGDAGVADKWYDIAILVKSLRRNYETKDAEEYLFKCLNLKPDYKKIEYYILLTELFL